jgi:hypothetical protein
MIGTGFSGTIGWRMLIIGETAISPSETANLTYPWSPR